MATQTPKRRSWRSGYKLFRALGVDVVADWSVLIILGVVVFGLGGSVLPEWHPSWSAWMIWLVAVGVGVGFIASIAVHELAHALVASRLGMQVRTITLFVFGGATHMRGTPKSPTDEMRVAVAGPLVSFVLGVVLTLLAVALGANPSDADADQLASSIGPAATMLVWLGAANILLALFNLLPGFPLDGGRVIRALLWRSTGSLRRATRWASRFGRGLGWVLMIVGVSLLFGVLGGGPGNINGLWLLLIGWFLNNAAGVSYDQLIIRQALADVEVRDLVRSRQEPTVESSSHLDTVLAGPALDVDGALLAVVNDEALAGVIDLSRLAQLSQQSRQSLHAVDVMTPVADVETLHPNDDATTALRRLSVQNPVPVVEGDDRRLVGMLYERDVMRWLAFHADDLDRGDSLRIT